MSPGERFEAYPQPYPREGVRQGGLDQTELGAVELPPMDVAHSFAPHAYEGFTTPWHQRRIEAVLAPQPVPRAKARRIAQEQSRQDRYLRRGEVDE